jgi:FlaG/FlaF family flagellin (archaellin)
MNAQQMSSMERIVTLSMAAIMLVAIGFLLGGTYHAMSKSDVNQPSNIEANIKADE